MYIKVIFWYYIKSLRFNLSKANEKEVYMPVRSIPFFNMPNLLPGEQVVVLSAYAADEFLTPDAMALRVYVNLLGGGLSKEELDRWQIIPRRCGWSIKPEPRDRSQCLLQEPAGRLWVVYTKTPKQNSTVPIGEKGLASSDEGDGCEEGGIIRI
jgi:hypothetical protein